MCWIVVTSFHERKLPERFICDQKVLSAYYKDTSYNQEIIALLGYNAFATCFLNLQVVVISLSDNVEIQGIKV